nr:DNA polymerase III subunit delta' [Campylobacter sp.]
MQSKIIISNDFEAIKTEFLCDKDPNYLRFFEFENALVENAREIINEAYIAESKEKTIIVHAKKFGLEWQNALLKILEEPPRNIVFVIVSPEKNLLIPTIRSRLIMENRTKKPNMKPLNLDLTRLDLKTAYNFIDEQINLEKEDKLNKNELLILLKNIVCKALDLGIKFKSEDLEYFAKLYKLAELNAKVPQILTPLLLLIIKRQK